MNRQEEFAKELEVTMDKWEAEGSDPSVNPIYNWVRSKYEILLKKYDRDNEIEKPTIAGRALRLLKEYGIERTNPKYIDELMFFEHVMIYMDGWQLMSDKYGRDWREIIKSQVV